MRATAAVLYEIKKPVVVEEVEVNHAFDLMVQGEVKRSVIVYG